MQYKVTAEIGGKTGYAIFEYFVGLRESEFRAFTVAALGNAVGNRAVGNNTRDQNLFTLKKTHLILTFLTMDNGLDFS